MESGKIMTQASGSIRHCGNGTFAAGVYGKPRIEKFVWQILCFLAAIFALHLSSDA